MQSRLRSKIAWTTLIPIILLLGDTYNFWNVIGMPKTTFTQLVISIGALLTAFGVFNNPEKNGEF